MKNKDDHTKLVISTNKIMFYTINLLWLKRLNSFKIMKWVKKSIFTTAKMSSNAETSGTSTIKTKEANKECFTSRLTT